MLAPGSWLNSDGPGKDWSGEVVPHPGCLIRVAGEIATSVHEHPLPAVESVSDLVVRNPLVVG